MSFWDFMKAYFKRVRIFYGLQKQDTIIPEKKQNIKTIIDIKPKYKTIERK